MLICSNTDLFGKILHMLEGLRYNFLNCSQCNKTEHMKHSMVSKGIAHAASFFAVEGYGMVTTQYDFFSHFPSIHLNALT